MAAGRKKDIAYYLFIAALVALVGLSFWYRYQGNALAPGTKQGIQSAQIGLVVLCVILFFISFRHPLRNMNQSLFKERRRIEREKRRSKTKR